MHRTTLPTLPLFRNGLDDRQALKYSNEMCVFLCETPMAVFFPGKHVGVFWVNLMVQVVSTYTFKSFSYLKMEEHPEADHFGFSWGMVSLT